jgi:hypothetical protein
MNSAHALKREPVRGMWIKAQWTGVDHSAARGLVEREVPLITLGLSEKVLSAAGTSESQRLR